MAVRARIKKYVSNIFPSSTSVPSFMKIGVSHFPTFTCEKHGVRICAKGISHIKTAAKFPPFWKLAGKVYMTTSLTFLRMDGPRNIPGVPHIKGL